MKTYVIVTGSVFGLVTLAHVWRFFVERHVGTDPFFLAITVIAASLCAWAVWLVGSTPRSRDRSDIHRGG
jgi:hypothetical protein